MANAATGMEGKMRNKAGTRDLVRRDWNPGAGLLVCGRPRRRTRLRVLLAVSALLLLLLIAVPAQAAFRGRNGQIAWAYSIAPTPSGSGSFSVTQVNPTTGQTAFEGSCSYEATGNVGVTHCPAWSSISYSPDGHNVLWVTVPDADVGSGAAAITVMNSDFSAPVTIDHPDENDAQASFSPDGRRIIYVRTIHGRSEVVTSNVAGDDVRVIGRLPSNSMSPKFFPSGRAILFTRHNTIWSARSDGRDARPLIRGGTAPDISPNGRLIAYVGVNSGLIYLANANGTRRRAVSLRGALCRPDTCDAVAGEAVVFSPDGRKLAFAWGSSPDGVDDPTLYTVPVTGGTIKQIGDAYSYNGGDTTGLNWQPLH
jgi:Tol biopolymer transport system component